MSNSVVKVTDATEDDSLLLLVGEDGTVTPSKDIVEAYLNSKSGATNLHIMHINKSDDQSIEVAVNDMLYLPDTETDESAEQPNFDEIAYNLYNIKLDHDYVCQSEPTEEVDELAKTLSILDGDVESPGRHISTFCENESREKNITGKADILEENSSISSVKITSTPVKPNFKTHHKRLKSKEIPDKDDNSSKIDDDLENNSYMEDDGEENKTKSAKKNFKLELKNKGVKQIIDLPKEKSPSATHDSKLAEKKPVKKERKLSKTVPDDFALFSTPDIIRRVGGKDSTSPGCPATAPVVDSCTFENKPAKIEIRSKSVSESTSFPKKQDRLSLDGKLVDKQFAKVEIKNKDKKIHGDLKIKREHFPKKSAEPSKSYAEISSSTENVLEDTSITPGSDEKYASNLPVDSSDLGNTESGITLDGNSLDLDPALLENINNDLISEDILYQVAQSLVSNTELQNAIDKSLNEESLVLQSPGQDILDTKDATTERNVTEQVKSCGLLQKGTQIVRPDGRIVVIPPIERPTTRSRNKKSSEEIVTAKFNRKPLDEEHVSGNELDSSGEDEEESEDDPNKLWCICNQPHNNRFMICCDTCEEWYHGKCVNITKAMGQQMESEGREWICLFCKDPMLRRPQAAAKRIRKASRNSRQSSDSNSSLKLVEVKPNTVPCVVCQKPSRNNSIFCSEACILTHAQGVERVVVFERSSGNMLTGNKAPSAANLEQWLKDHPGYEVVRSAGKIVTTKTQLTSQSKLKLIKNLNNETRSPVFKNKNFNGGVVTKSIPKSQPHLTKPANKANISGLKIIKQISPSHQKDKVYSSSKESIISSPTKIKTIQSPIKVSSSPVNREKSAPTKIQKVRHADQPSSSTPQPKQENIRENVQKTIFEQLTNRLKMVDDLKVSEEDLKDISTEIESQLYKCFGDTGQKYRNKYRSLIFNIKDIKNQTLWRRICEKSINPYQLVRLSPDDLASQELALWREREAKHQLDMIKKSELELLKCSRQYVLKTHKGEQILEDNRPTDHIDNTEVITSLTDVEKSERKIDSSKENDRKNHKHGHKEKEKDRKSNKERSDSKSHHSYRSSSRDDRSRKRSRSRDKNSKHTDRRRPRSRGRDRHRKSSHKSSRHKKGSHRGSSTEKLDKKSKEILEQLVDNKIVPPLEDRLWKHVPQDDILSAPIIESDSDHEPTSTVIIPTPPRNSESDDFLTNQPIGENKNEKLFGKERVEEDGLTTSPQTKSDEIWRGVINMIDVAQISITAHEVSGDCNGLSSELPANLDIVGRISPDTVWDYIGKMKCSNSKIISIVRLNAINVEEKMPYLALYSYLSSRNRLGVVKSTNKAVKDFYILPLASQKPIPQALLPLNGPGFEEARPALLLGIIVRDKRKRPYVDTIPPIVTSSKKTKIDLVIPPPRSYTPPPLKESRVKLPLPASDIDQDGDEPYSPEDSDPDSIIPSTTENIPNKTSNFLESDVGTSQTFQPFANKFDDIPGLENAALPSSTQEIQRQMEKLNKEIEMQKSEINSISQNIATASTEIGTTALANIALPSNLQQILDSIKTIGATGTMEVLDTKSQNSGLSQENSDFTIPLMLPTTFSRQSVSTNVEDFPETTIPLNLPSKKKVTSETDKSGSVLSSLSEEDLIRKAEEMLEDSKKNSRGDARSIPKPTHSLTSVSNSITPRKLPKVELSQPPIPGLEDTEI
ncbi:death-inducer obliterator 1-like isoform X1 [Zophobas morio]|uniref:death-inducer obliterator 1-like isoform X1 n=1 Tax=Zophobas morio TaxID=2755281 RepID=UPI003082CE08